MSKKLSRINELNDREIALVRQLALGEDTKDIAQSMGLKLESLYNAIWKIGKKFHGNPSIYKLSSKYIKEMVPNLDTTIPYDWKHIRGNKALVLHLILKGYDVPEIKKFSKLSSNGIASIIKILKKEFKAKNRRHIAYLALCQLNQGLEL